MAENNDIIVQANNGKKTSYFLEGVKNYIYWKVRYNYKCRHYLMWRLNVLEEIQN